jgi:hypothetical protein
MAGVHETKTETMETRVLGGEAGAGGEVTKKVMLPATKIPLVIQTDIVLYILMASCRRFIRQK